MNSKYCDHFDETVDRFEGWWNGDDLGGPLTSIIAKRTTDPLPDYPQPEKVEDLYLNAEYIANKYRYFCENHCFLGDSYPNISADLGPGSLALYIGGQPRFEPDTVWFSPVLEDSTGFRTLEYDEDNYWWKLHQQLIRDLKKYSNGDFMINLPDIIENLDILAALRDPQELCFDLYDNDDDVHKGLENIDRLYFKYFDAFRDITADNNVMSFTAFKILGRGRIAKLQSDFSAMISDDMFRDMVKPSLEKQCKHLDHALYHLDGPGEICHVDSLMEIKELNALQWTCGAGQPDGGYTGWYPIYDKVRAAGKSLWIMMEDGTPKDWYKGARGILDRYGSRGIYLLFPVFDDLKTAQEFEQALKD